MDRKVFLDRKNSFWTASADTWICGNPSRLVGVHSCAPARSSFNKQPCEAEHCQWQRAAGAHKSMFARHHGQRACRTLCSRQDGFRARARQTQARTHPRASATGKKSARVRRKSRIQFPAHAWRGAVARAQHAAEFAQGVRRVLRRQAWHAQEWMRMQCGVGARPCTRMLKQKYSQRCCAHVRGTPSPALIGPTANKGEPWDLSWGFTAPECTMVWVFCWRPRACARGARRMCQRLREHTARGEGMGVGMAGEAEEESMRAHGL